MMRLQKELKDLQQKPQEDGVFIEEVRSTGQWVVGITGAPGTLYDGEKFLLRFSFPSVYPMESPEVVFEGDPPVHPHIYTNGHSCLSILYDAWSPALTVYKVCVSIQSMLSSCTLKVPPRDNDAYVAMVGVRSPKLTTWNFDDDTV